MAELFVPEVNDIIFFGNVKDINLIEYIALVDFYDKDKNIVNAHNVMTIYKVTNIAEYNPIVNNKKEYIGYTIPYMGIISTNTIEDTTKTTATVDVGNFNINLNNFDLYGEVRDKNIIDILTKMPNNRETYKVKLIKNNYVPILEKEE